MNRNQVISILLSALLCSTFAHEYLQAHAQKEYHARLSQHNHESRHHNHHQAARSHHLLARDNDNDETCTFVCSGEIDIGGDLQIIVNETSSIVLVVNATANVALALDINAGIVAVLNGNTGAAVLIDIEAQTGVYLKSGVWLKIKVSIDVWLQSVTSLKVLLSIEGGVKFTIKDITDAILQEIATVLVGLVAGLADRIKADLKVVIQILLKVSQRLIIVLKGTLKGILKLIGVAALHIRGDLVWLVNVLEGLAVVIGHISGGLAALIKANVELDFKILLAASSGLELLINLLIQIGAKINLKVLASLLNNIEALLKVIVQLGGNVTVGVNGLFRVIYYIVAFVHNKVNLQVLINVLLQFSVNVQSNIDIKTIIQGLLKVIAQQEKIWQNSAELKGLIEFAKNIAADALIIAGINISTIIGILVTKAGKGLELVVAIINEINKTLKNSDAFATLILQIVALVTSVAGLELLVRIIPGLNINFEAIAKGDIIGALFGNFNLESLIGIFTSGFKLDAILHAIPVVGTIVDALNEAFKVALSGSIKIGDILGKASEQITEQFKAFLLVILRPPQGSVIAKVLGNANFTFGASLTVGLNVWESVSVSGSGAVTDNPGSVTGSVTGSGSEEVDGSVTGSGSGGVNASVTGSGSGSGGVSWGWSIDKKHAHIH